MASYLYRNSPVPTSEKTFTFSTWLKLSSTSTAADNGIVEWYKSSSERYQVLIDSATRKLRVYAKESNTVKVDIYTDMVLRDPSAFYHIVIHGDTTETHASDRVKIWVNGIAQTFSNYSYNFNQNANINVFDGSSTRVNLGTRGEAYATFLNGLLSDTYYIDGSKIAVTEFGSTDNSTGQWKPKVDPTISSFGNAGFHLKYEDASNIGLDSSGNTNNLTASGTVISTLDNPSNVFATLNPLQTNLTTLHDGNNSAGTTSNYQYGVSTFGMNSGKYYFEIKVSHGCAVIGIQDMNKAQDRIFGSGTFWYSGSQSYHLDGFSKFSHDSYGDISSSSTDYPTYGSGDIIMMAVDLDNNKLAYGKNGTI